MDCYARRSTSRRRSSHGAIGGAYFPTIFLAILIAASNPLFSLTDLTRAVGFATGKT